MDISLVVIVQTRNLVLLRNGLGLFFSFHRVLQVAMHGFFWGFFWFYFSFFLFLSATVPSGFSAYAYSVPCIFSVLSLLSRPNRRELFEKVQNSHGLRPWPDHVFE